ncbi:MAG: hypothetical protein LBR75_04225 [Prevotellaceae bacterium]|jgi:hypothetical protein|nr:hypothetical protein [Prevotellaceae bacterium]
MKKSILIRTLLIAAVLLATTGASAQVTIGNGEIPIAGSLLQLKNKTGITDDAVNAHLGLAMPRVALSDKNELYPMFLNVHRDPNSGATDIYAANKEAIDKAHTGLIVYNVSDEGEGLCIGLNQWNGTEWNCFEAKLGTAQFAPVACSAIGVSGAYIEDSPANSTNFLTLRLNVTRPGAYSITAMTENGYSFFLSGVALSLGDMVVTVPCQGTPMNVSSDQLVFTGIELEPGCEPTVTVVSAVADYSLNCSSVTVQGTYVKDTPLTSANTITMSITVSKAGSWYITTQPMSGVTFSGSGTFPTTGTFTLTLYGSGTPRVNNDFEVGIVANTTNGNPNCSAIIPITLPGMTYAVIGEGDYSWASNVRQSAFNSDSFGPDGIVKIESLSQLWEADDADEAVDYIGTTKPDIILYFAYGAAPNKELSDALANYIKQGGVVIYGSADGTETQVNILMEGVFGTQWRTATAQSGGSGDDNVYRISNLPLDPIINGPFGNLGGQYWGEDNAQGGSVIMTTLPPNSIQIATARSTTNTTRDPGNSIVWYNDSFNFAYFGDSVAAARSNTATGGYPASYTATGLPLSKNYGPGASNNQYVYNAALELNAVAWAIKKAAVSGINPH